MAVDKNALRSVTKNKKDMVLFKDEKIIPTKMYEIVCAEDYVYPLGGKVYFKAGEPTKVNGLFAQNIVKLTRGKVMFVDKDLWNESKADMSRDDEIAELKAAVKALTSKKEEVDVEVKNAVPKDTVKKATTKKTK